jgi:hypothetical protein
MPESHFDPHGNNASPAPWIAWVLLIILINAYWTFYDFYLAPKYGWRMLTTEFRDGLNTPFGCFIIGGTAFVVCTFTAHMLNVRTLR